MAYGFKVACFVGIQWLGNKKEGMSFDMSFTGVYRLWR